ncbi:hypothetical protein [Microbacterium sp.]|uniref:hypothetical protein n=1 Tax=Microbacterium sp. TaxID=51671 RepID=UPI0025FBFB13|nr:hypothetical protein [Microbacterium sp.]MBT9606520.1 hypothetical protein [Microbacterium sp.]
MSDELTPDERAALRARIVGGAGGITPAGAHRGAWIAGSIAAALVVAIAGGVFATSALTSPPVATTPSPSPTLSHEPTREPTPTATPTSTPESPAVAFDGDCAKVLSDDDVSAIVGVPMTLSNGLSAEDAGVLGGVVCQWRAQGERYEAVGVQVFPTAVVPESLQGSLGVPPDCGVDGFNCRSTQRFGEAIVSAWGARDDQVTALLEAVGPRGAASPGRARTLPSDAWTVPDCDRVLQIAEAARGRGDLVPHQGDYYPSGLAWDVMSANGAAGYCALDNRSAINAATVVDIFFGPGSMPDLAEIARRSGTEVAVAGADAAWFFPEFTSTMDHLLVQSGPNVLMIGTASMNEEEMAQLAAGLIAALG